MKSKRLGRKLVKLRKKLKVSIQSEFEKTNLQKIQTKWDLSLKDRLFPDADWKSTIESLSKNGVMFKTIGFQRWQDFYEFDLVKILEFLEKFNNYLSSAMGPVSWDMAKSHYFDSGDVKNPELYLWSVRIDEEGNEIYFPFSKLKKR